jgi:glycerol-3-phosphate dehydrogenase
MVPHTKDGRVMFAIPYLGATLVGTTDTPIVDMPLEPRARPEEIDFILETAGMYLQKAPSRGDILSVFAGIRPLVGASNDKNTASLSRDHTIIISNSGLLTIAGGKWTTYRQMAEDCVGHAATLAGLEARACVTKRLNIHGYHKSPQKFGSLAVYGSDAPAIQDLLRADAARQERIHPALPAFCGEVIWAVRFEGARTIDDFLARRTRSLFLNARAAMEAAPRVASLMAAELGYHEQWEREQVAEFQRIGRWYLPES